MLIGPKILIALGLATLSLGACASDVRTVFDEPTLRPGDRVTCVSNPCSVYFESPAGTGAHDLIEGDGTVNEGAATGGKRVYLGQYYPGDTVFFIKGADLPKAYLNVLDGM